MRCTSSEVAAAAAISSRQDPDQDQHRGMAVAPQRLAVADSSGVFASDEHGVHLLASVWPRFSAAKIAADTDTDTDMYSMVVREAARGPWVDSKDIECRVHLSSSFFALGCTSYSGRP